MVTPKVLLTITFLLLLTEARERHSRDNDHSGRHKTKIKAPYQNSKSQSEEKEIYKHYDESNAVDSGHKVECHQAILRKCGHSFLKVFDLLTFVPKEKVFETECVLRSAFFTCLNQLREKLCKKYKPKHNQKYDNNFRQKLTEALWSTRICILGIKNYYPKEN